jgi:hypothetical protein
MQRLVRESIETEAYLVRRRAHSAKEGSSTLIPQYSDRLLRKRSTRLLKVLKASLQMNPLHRCSNSLRNLLGSGHYLFP